VEISRGDKYKCRIKVYHKDRKRIVCTKTKRRTKAAMTPEDLKANKAPDNQHKELAPKYSEDRNDLVASETIPTASAS
jgi:hypothetical protein